MFRMKIEIWGRELEIKVYFDCFSNDFVMLYQIEALSNFLKNADLFPIAKSKAEQYCLKDFERNTLPDKTESKFLIEETQVTDPQITNIFRYVVPTGLYVSRTRDGSHKVAILCDYRFDEEHGIAIVFKNNCFDSIVSQDEVL